ncbi:MAG: pantoate--beta-alanine ligase [Bryobacterales bacterium]|nr:pantoate--beta-alanine ligase [Bryobacterales bacterium]
MHVADSVAGWLAQRRQISEGKTLGFVPTMGALHRGHASLVERSVSENDLTVVSIFVNPTQFNDPKDLDRYPRTFEADLDLLRGLGVDYVFSPSQADLYPHGYRFRVESEAMTSVMEGIHRPGFLQGVMTVVLKLLNIVRANRAYFGEKDYQQLQTIKEMVDDFFVGTEIVACETIREESGLAESSRNRLLSESGRVQAAAIYKALTRCPDVESAARTLAAQGFTIDYLEEHWGRRFAAVFLESIRLIDNVPAPSR